MTNSHMGRLVDTYFDGIRTADASKFEEVCGPCFALVLPQYSIGLPKMERGEAIQFLVTAPGNLVDTSSMSVEKLNVLEGESEHVVEVNIKAKMVDGRDYNNMYVLWFKFEDDKISMCREHTDTAYVFGLQNSAASSG